MAPSSNPMKRIIGAPNPQNLPVEYGFLKYTLASFTIETLSVKKY